MKQNDPQKQTDYLTPMDFIHLIRTDPEMADEFCYLNKNSNPYDFKIVEFDARNPREYMTISARVDNNLSGFFLFYFEKGNNTLH